jgi:hypothetical protein
VSSIHVQTSSRSFNTFSGRCLTEIAAQLESVIDWSGALPDGLTNDLLVSDASYVFTQTLAREARRAGADGLLVPSATSVGTNLIVFPDVRLPRLLVMRQFIAPRAAPRLG